MSPLRVGIDVGGTFTDAVAVDAASRAILARVKVPTTHAHAQGVAAGIVESVRRLVADHAVDPAAIAFIAHSTTQATNALLEGDLARVAVFTVARGPFAWLAHGAMRFGSIPLGAGRSFAPLYFSVEDDADAALRGCECEGIEAIAVSTPFGVDRRDLETRLVERARERGFAATSGHEVSGTYGLRARTRTAALNAAVLPLMLNAARMTSQAVERAGIAAPLMIMRGDGGVMSVGEVERRPILTLLSGPAAGVAGALLHENVTDGIFIEVGGTSADCSVIRNGTPAMRPARIGGFRTMLRTLDVRTLGIAGGSLVVLEGNAVRDVGPRSAHIAGYAYASFSSEREIASARFDPGDGYAALTTPEGARIALTPTCAANVLGTVPEGAFAQGDRAAAERAFALAGTALGIEPAALARRILDVATEKLRSAIDELIADYGLDRATVALVGGGGGAAALIPYAGRALGFSARIARDAEVISPLGVALALVRDVVERTIVHPSPGDVVNIRREAREAAVAAGADPERVEVAVELDPRRNLVRATASGATALVEAAAHAAVPPAQRLAAVARQLSVAPGAVAATCAVGAFTVCTAARTVRGRARRYACVVDDRAVVRLVLPAAEAVESDAGSVGGLLARAIEEATAFGDVGRVLPDVYLLYNARVAELRGLTSAGQAIALAREELAGLPERTPVAVLLAAASA